MGNLRPIRDTLMDKTEIQQAMQETLMDTYLHPDRKACYYSADHEQTASEFLDSLPAWDWTPQRSHQVKGNNTCIFPLALGCKRVIAGDNTEWAQTMFSEQELLTKSQLDICNQDIRSGKTGQLLNNIEAMLETLRPDERIRSVDPQSPFGIAEIICGSSLYMALVMNPEAVHGLLQRITDFVIEYLQEQRRVAGNHLNGAAFPYVWHDHTGAYCSDDSLTLMSPEMHAEFSLPYINQIAEKCGPLFYHSCTWKEKYFNNIMKVKNVRAFNWNPSNSIDPAIIIREFSGSAVLAPHIGIDMHESDDTKQWGSFSDEAEFMRHILDSMQDNTTLYLWLGHMQQKPDVLEKMYHILDDYGYSPRAQGLC